MTMTMTRVSLRRGDLHRIPVRNCPSKGTGVGAGAGAAELPCRFLWSLFHGELTQCVRSKTLPSGGWTDISYKAGPAWKNPEVSILNVGLVSESRWYLNDLHLLLAFSHDFNLLFRVCSSRGLLSVEHRGQALGFRRVDFDRFPNPFFETTREIVVHSVL